MASVMAVNESNVIPLRPESEQPARPRRGLFARIGAVKDSLSAALSTKINKETLTVAAENLTAATKTIGGFLRDGVAASAERVRNMTASDWKWAGLSVGAGVAAKVGVFAALGVASGGTVAAALLGGAVVGVTRSAINHVRESQKAQPKSTWKALLGLEKNYIQKDHFFSTKTLMNTASSAAISAATFGVLSGVEHFSGVNIAEKINQGLSRTFNWAADRVAGTSWWQSFASRETARMIADGYDMSHGLNARSGKIKFDVPFDVSENKATVGANKNIDDATREAALAKVRAWEATQVKAPAAIPAPAAVAIPAGLEGRTLAESAIGNETGMTVPRDMPDAPMPDPSKPVEIEIKTADGETTIIKAHPMPNLSEEYAIAQNAIEKEYVTAHLRQFILNTTGVAPDESMSVEDMAKQIVPSNPRAYLEVLARDAAEKAVKLDPSRMAAACVTDLPKTAAALAGQGHVLPNTCAIAKGMEEMADGDYVLVRDAAEAEPNAKRGLRALFKETMDGAADGAAEKAKEKTADFIDKVVAGYQIPDMAEQKIDELATAEAERYQNLALAPNP
jgi:hypothetical protein